MLPVIKPELGEVIANFNRFEFPSMLAGTVIMLLDAHLIWLVMLKRQIASYLARIICPSVKSNNGLLVGE